MMVLKEGNPNLVGMSAEKISYIDSLVPKWIEEGVTPAFISQVCRKGIIVYRNAHGKLTPEDGSPPITTEAMFPICSISKVITATAAMILVEDGLLSLNRSISWYIHEFTGEGKEWIPVHSLLTHTSGLTDEGVHKHTQERYGRVEIPPCDKNQHPGVHERLCLSYDAPLQYKPGTQMIYCNFGIELMGEIIRRVSGKSLDAFFSERIFRPLGMNHTYVVVPEEVRNLAVRFPKDSEHGPWLSNDMHFETPSAAGGIYSTVGDMCIFGQMILNKGIYNNIRILSPLGVEEMTHNRIPGVPAKYGDEIFPEASWGLGWNIFGNKLDIESGPLQSKSAFGHGGAGRSMLWIDPEYDVVGFLFYVKMPPEFRRPDDLFRNGIMSSIYEK